MKSFIDPDSKVRFFVGRLDGPSIDLRPCKVFDSNVMPEMLQNRFSRTCRRPTA